jgi:hypothetical protein
MKWTTEYPYRAPRSTVSGGGAGAGCKSQPHRCGALCRTYVKNGKKYVTHCDRSNVTPLKKGDR